MKFVCKEGGISVEVIVDVREWVADDDGEADVEDIGDGGLDDFFRIEDGIDDNGGSLSIYNKQKNNMSCTQHVSYIITSNFYRVIIGELCFILANKRIKKIERAREKKTKK